MVAHPFCGAYGDDRSTPVGENTIPSCALKQTAFCILMVTDVGCQDRVVGVPVADTDAVADSDGVLVRDDVDDLVDVRDAVSEAAGVPVKLADAELDPDAEELCVEAGVPVPAGVPVTADVPELEMDGVLDVVSALLGVDDAVPPTVMDADDDPVPLGVMDAAAVPEDVVDADADEVAELVLAGVTDTDEVPVMVDVRDGVLGGVLVMLADPDGDADDVGVHDGLLVGDAVFDGVVV